MMQDIQLKPLVWVLDTESNCTRARAEIYRGHMMVVELDPGSGVYSAGIDLGGLSFRFILDMHDDGYGGHYRAPKKYGSQEDAMRAAEAEHAARVFDAIKGYSDA